MTGPSLWSFLGDSSERERQGTPFLSRMGASVKRPHQFLLSLEKFRAACFLCVGGI